MEIYEISTGSSEGNVEELKNVIKENKLQFIKAVLNVTPMPLPIENSKDWPIIFKCILKNKKNEEVEIRIDRLTCGFRGKDPKNLIKVLHIAGFESFFNDEEIFKKKRIEETYVKI